MASPTNLHPMKLRSGSGGMARRNYHSSDFSRLGTTTAAHSYKASEDTAPGKHYSKEHYVKNTHHIETSGGFGSPLVTQLLSPSQLGSSPLLQSNKATTSSTTTSSVVQRLQQQSRLDSSAFSNRSGYSSGYDTTEEQDKTDYTYAHSLTYRSHVTPNRECPTPNMSRTALYRFSRNHSYLTTDEEEEDDIFHSLKSKLATSQHHYNTAAAARTDTQDNTAATLRSSQSSSLNTHPLARSHLFTSHYHQQQDTSILKRWLRYITWSREEGSSARSSLCLPLWWLLLAIAAVGALLWASGHQPSHLVNSTLIHQMFTPSSYHHHHTSPQPLFNGTSEELQSLVQHLLQQQLARRDGRLDQLDHNLASVQASLLSLSQGVETNLETSRATCSRSQAEWNQTTQRLQYLERQVENLIAKLGEMKECCSNNSAALSSLQKSVGQLLVDVMGDSDHPFARWLQHKFVLRPAPGEPKMRLEEELSNSPAAAAANVSDLRSLVWSTVHQALAQYDADKTGQADYALESAGGSVVSTRCSEAYQDRSAQFSVFGIPLWHFSHSPRKVIQPGVSPGECWPFRGSQGYLVIQLSTPVTPTAFTLEHIPASLSPSGHIDSAPRHFTVLGLSSEKETEGVVLGHFTYDITKEPLQTFPVQTSDPGVFPFIELRIESNHGNLEYTCLYRFRVHGIRSSH